MLTFGSFKLGKWISSQGSSSQVRGVHVVESFTSSTHGEAAAAAGGSAAGPAAAGDAEALQLPWPAAAPVRQRDGVPAARSGVAIAAPPPARVRANVGEAAPRLVPPSLADSSLSASSPAVERTGGSALSGGCGADHSTSQLNNNWISRSRSVLKFCNAACVCGPIT